MNRSICVFLILAIFTISLSAREINLNQTFNTIKNSDKHLLIWLHKTNCGYCDSMQINTLKNNQIKAYIDEKFLFVHINISDNDKVIYKKFVGSGRDFAKHMGFDFYPTSLFFTQRSQLIYKAIGYHNEILFGKILKFIDTQSYQNMDYDTFENNNDFKEEL